MCGRHVAANSNSRKQHMFCKLEPDRGAIRPVTISVDGVDMTVEEGEPIAAVLLRIPPFTARATPVSGAARAPYCMMGVCFECLVEIDGETSTRSCLTRARDGMAVRRQAGRPDPLRDIGA
jgi:D-hydroxyproline dehydrogenase subunit gamma